MRHMIPSRAELDAAYGEAVDRWAGHQRAAHPTDEQHNGCCPECADLVEQIDLHRLAVDAFYPAPVLTCIEGGET